MQDEAVHLLQEIRDLNIDNIFGVCRLHRHFLLRASECVVSTKVPDGYFAEVKEYSDEYVPWQFKYC